jgi:hypothetical protein
MSVLQVDGYNVEADEHGLNPPPVAYGFIVSHHTNETLARSQKSFDEVRAILPSLK